MKRGLAGILFFFFLQRGTNANPLVVISLKLHPLPDGIFLNILMTRSKSFSSWLCAPSIMLPDSEIGDRALSSNRPQLLSKISFRGLR